MKIDNLTDVFCYVSAILVVVDMDSCSLDTGLRRPWQWELGAFTLSHLAQPPLPAQVRGVNPCPEDNIVCHLFLRNVPFFGIYVVMFIDVSYTFMKVSVVVLPFIFAFERK